MASPNQVPSVMSVIDDTLALLDQPLRVEGDQCMSSSVYKAIYAVKKAKEDAYAVALREQQATRAVKAGLDARFIDILPPAAWTPGDSTFECQTYLAAEVDRFSGYALIAHPHNVELAVEVMRLAVNCFHCPDFEVPVKVYQVCAAIYKDHVGKPGY